MADAEIHDLFLSYRYALGEQVRPLVEALRARGLRVWQDRSDIEELASIQRSIREGLARSRALLVWYSADYNDSRACQWELTSAYLAAQADPTTGGDVLRRILVVNPQPGLPAQVVLPELFGQLHLNASELSADELAEHIVTRLAQAVPATPLGELRALTPPRMLPNGLLGSTRFVGRLAPMWQVHRALQSGETALLTGRAGSGQTGLVQVRGAGGIGKSLLAEEYALRFGAAYPGGIFWIRAEGYTDRDEEISPTERMFRLESQIIGFAQQLELHISGLSPREVKGLFAGHLGRRGQPFLWIVDDLPADPGPDGLAPWLAPHPLGRTLITTRARRFNHVSLIELPQLGNDEALRLLSRGKPLGDTDRPVAEAICRELGNHALAVDVAAALIEQRGFASVLDRLQQARTDKDVLEVAARLDEALPNGHQRSIAATLLASIRELDAPTLDVLGLAALLAPTPIPRDLIWRTIAYADDLDPDDAQDLCDPALSRAKSSSLADPVDDGGIVVHTLVSRTMRLHEPDAARTEPLRAAAVAVLNQEMPRAEDIREHASLKEWVPHARYLTTELRDATVFAMAFWVARYDAERGEHAIARTGWERLLTASLRLFGEEHPQTLASMNNLAGTLRDQGDLPAARRLLDTVLQTERHVLGERHPATLTTMNNLAGLLLDQGVLLGARDLYDKVLQLRLDVLGDEHPDTVTSMHDLALARRELCDFPGAQNLQETVLQIQYRILGENHSHSLTSMYNLAATLFARGKIVAAQETLTRVLENQLKALGEAHPNTLSSIETLALVLRSKGELEASRKLQEKAFTVHCRTLGEVHPTTLRSLSNLAETRRMQGDLEAACAIFEEVAQGLVEVLGNEHPDAVGAMCNLASARYAKGDLPGAHKLLLPVLQIQRRVMGEEHQSTLGSMSLLALILRAQGDHCGALDIHDKVLRAQLEVFGEDHPAALLEMNNRAGTLQAQGDLAGAHSQLLIALSTQQRVLGGRHNDTTRLAWNLLHLQETLGYTDDANQLRSELLDWLLTSQPETLSGQQQKIAQMLRQQSAPKP